MAHYVAFLSTVNHCAFFSIASCFARWAEKRCPDNNRDHFMRPNRRLILSSYLHLQFPTLLWLSIKFEVNHFALNLLIVTVSNSTDQISYFHNLLKLGKLMDDS